MKATKNKKRKISYGTVELPEGALDPKNVKIRVTAWIDLDIIKLAKDESKLTGKGYQTCLNERLRKSYFGDESSEIEKRIAALEKKLKVG